jgi:glycosyltransferase involved in cell wall biosynthesis
MSNQECSVAAIPGLVSVIMPAYNAERFIAEAIESVLAQTYPHWELIIVDDGSTDTTPDIVVRFNDPRIKVIRQANKGEGGARNTGLDVAQGEFIGFLDADDAYLSNALTDFVWFFNNRHEFDVAISDGYMCNDRLQPLMRISEHRVRCHAGRVLEPLVLHPTVVSQPVCMAARSSVLQAYRIRFDEELRYGVDWDFWTQLARVTNFGILDRITGLYRVHQTNMTHTATTRKRKDELVVGRLKVMRSPWFNDLSVRTRVGLFYYVLVDLLAGQPGRQIEVFCSPQFINLPGKERCHLLRRIASDYLRQQRQMEFAKQCLWLAHDAWPEDRKTWLLLRSTNFGQVTSQVVISAWRLAGRITTWIDSIRREVPKPAPDLLEPGND